MGDVVKLKEKPKPPEVMLYACEECEGVLFLMYDDCTYECVMCGEIFDE